MASAAVTLTGTLVLGALAYKGTDLVKYTSVAVLGPIGRRRSEEPGSSVDATVAAKARSDARNGLFSLLLGSAVGVGIVFLFAPTQLAGQVTIGGLTLADLSTASKVVFGLALTSLASLMFDGKKALDNTDTASKVKLTLASERTRQQRLDEMRGFIAGPAEPMQLMSVPMPYHGEHRAG